MKVDPRYLTEEGPEIFTGCELLIKGALETAGGVHLLGGYPGSPVAGFFDSLSQVKDLLNEKGIHAVINNNEALAAAMLNGSQAMALRGMIVFKSVGVHVAADALAMGNLSGAHPEGGAIAVYGDDPWCDSTQCPADSRFLSKHLHMPVIEPSNPQEVKDFVAVGFTLSRRSELFVGFIVPTNLADGGGSVQCHKNQYPALNARSPVELETAALDLGKRVLLPPNSGRLEATLGERHARAVAAARQLGLNRIEHGGDGRKRIGFITSGLAYGYLVQVLCELGLLGEYPILKLGMSYPLDAELVRQFAGLCDQIVVVEERRSFIEEQVGEVLIRARQQGDAAGQTLLWGKCFPGGLEGLPSTAGLHPSLLVERLAPLLKLVNGTSRSIVVPRTDPLDREIDRIGSTAQTDVGTLAERVPTFCPGCPHRDTGSVCLDIRKRFGDVDYMQRVHGRGPVDLIFHGDAGCYVILMCPPYSSLMHDYSGMGLGGGTGAGVDPFTTNVKVAMMGDSTFFHSGVLAISQAIKNHQDITFLILDNSTTAMTGHQPTPGVDYDLLGNPTAVQDIENVVQGVAGPNEVTIIRTDPGDRKRYMQVLEQAFLSPGVKVVIAEKECGIMRQRRQRRQERAIQRQKGFLPSWQHMNVNQEICRFCLECAETTVCPGLKHADTDYGPKMDTDVTQCVNDGACERIGACSAFEQVSIRRKRPPRSRLPELGLDDIPEPTKRPVDPSSVWRCYLAGVGGMGIGLATSILVRAGHKEGYEVLFFDKKGIAIRNGGISSQVTYNIARQPITAITPYGKADLLLGVDVLEAARALEGAGKARIASADRTAAIVNTDKVLTIHTLIGQDNFDPAALEAIIRRHTRQDDFLARNISRICEKYLGSKLYANIMMLGFAFQKGLIPVSMHSIAWAIKDTIRADFRKNLYAFNMGRKLVVQPDLFQGPPQRTMWRDMLEEKCRWTIRRQGRRGQARAEQLRDLLATAIEAMNALDESLKRAIVVRAYDCMRWGGIDYARRYTDQVRAVYARDDARRNFAATSAVIHNLAAAMLIKDGVFIAELATAPEKLARDRDKYNVNPSNGDSIRYRHLMHKRITLGRRSHDIRFAAPHWLMRVARWQRWLRRTMPLWHRRDRLFLARYEQAIAAFAPADAADYDRQLPALVSLQCLGCTNPRCQDSACPLGNQVPVWVQLAYEHRWREAAEVLHRTNNFPEFTSQICPAPCQDACKQSLSGYPVQIRDIERQIVDRAFAEGWVTPATPAKATGRKVAVVGAGPAGLAAAQQLARAGHAVTVFDKDAAAGGLLRYGVPQFRLAKDLIDRRVEQLRGEGVQFRFGQAVGQAMDAATLRRDFDAVMLSVGTQRARELNVPGREMAEVMQASEFLRRGNLGSPLPVRNKVVAVIGGGLTGEDCVEMALLNGARHVHQLEIMPRSADDVSAHDGKVTRRFCIATQAFTQRDGRLSGLRVCDVRWMRNAQTPTMKLVAGSDQDIAADVVVLAMGFETRLDDALAGQFGIDSDAATGAGKSYAVAEGVFVAGDIVTGPSYVASAIDSGRRAAAAVDEYLTRA